jgi:GT2 family glycosyltransferase
MTSPGRKDLEQTAVGEERVSVLITCFNRKATTLSAIAAVKGSTIAPQRLSIFLVDDGSRDGTSHAVREEHPDVTIVRGDGSLYWNGGMRRAWTASLAHPTEFFLWLNDDLAMLPGSLDGLLAAYRRLSVDEPKTIIVGKTRSLDDTHDTYGGRKQAVGMSRLRFRPLQEGESFCDTMNGNCVLIPASAAKDIGINSQYFRHSMGDMDYGLRARRVGYRLYQSDAPVGYQDHNPHNYAKPRSRALRDVLAFMRDPKGMPLSEWFHFCRQHGGWLWPVNFLSMYVKALAGGGPK